MTSFGWSQTMSDPMNGSVSRGGSPSLHERGSVLSGGSERKVPIGKIGTKLPTMIETRLE
jgi:hypothetical protein